MLYSETIIRTLNWDPLYQSTFWGSHCNLIYINRHPKASKRPTFPEISRQLSLPDPKLLQWTEEDKAVHPEAAKLGADLLTAQHLFKDLQMQYKEPKY
jgi:hypothetical protein